MASVRQRPARGLAGAALLVAAITVLARVTGFGRWIVFSKTVEGGCLADVYNTANLLPNVMFEVVAGGALAAVVVPVLAGAVERGDRDAAGRTVSALLTWAMLLLLPVAAAAAVLAGPIVRFFLGSGADCPGADEVARRMLLMFLPQLFCYGVAVVASGALQAHRRFLAAALAPLVSSAVVIGAYLLFAALADGSLGVAPGSADLVPRSAETALALGTTLGVLALALTVAVPLRATRMRLRPALAFPPGVGSRARVLAVAGIAVLLAQQGCLLVVNWLANHEGRRGAVTAYTWAWAVFLLPYAVLAVPIATSAFPRLAALFDAAGDGGPDAARVAERGRVTATTTRAVVAVSAGGAALVAGAAVPVSRLFSAGAHVADAPALAGGIAAFAPGLVGYGLVAHLGRVLYAAHQGRRAAVATVVGWAAVIVADVALVAAVPAHDTVAALAAGNSVGMTLAGLLLLAAVVRVAGRAALAGVARTVVATALAAAVAAVAGRAVGARFDDASFGAALLGAAGVALLAGVVFVAVAAATDRDTVRLLLRRDAPRG
jgi:putative peptidoglycan lipid II flippase